MFQSNFLIIVLAVLLLAALVTLPTAALDRDVDAASVGSMTWSASNSRLSPFLPAPIRPAGDCDTAGAGGCPL